MPPAVTLAELRARRGWTLREVQDRSGVNVATLSQLERGLMTPQPRHLAALADAFGVPVASWRVRVVLETEAA